MNHTPASSIPVVIVSSSGDERVAELKDVLLSIGYPVRAIPRSNDFSQVSDKEVVVCFCEYAPSTRLQHQQFLKLLKIRPVLGVVPSDSTKDCQLLVDNCADFCTWPCQAAELEVRISRILNRQKCARSLPATSSSSDDPLNKLVGKSPGFIKSIKQIHRVAPFDAPVLITGETGTGKEIVARAIHYQGSRRGGPFIPVNCGALPENLIENELFGHERGAYTDANKDRHGLIRQADGGTLFLDEIDALPINKGQTALLRVFEDLEYRPLGGGTAIPVDVRVIAATNSHLAKLVERNEFRADLFYRLNILRIKLPPLRDRGRDIELLSEHFLKCFSAQYGLEKRISLEGLNSLFNYPWPGNVRELENFLHREYLQQDDKVLGCRSLAETKEATPIQTPERPGGTHTVSFRQAKAETVSRFEREYLVRVIAESRGNISEAARLSGKERRALGRLLTKHNIEAASFRKTAH